MGLVGVAPATMRPTALALNILVASIVTSGSTSPDRSRGARCCRSCRFDPPGLHRWRAHAAHALYKPLAGAVLLVAAARLAWTAGRAAAREEPSPRVPSLPAVGVGGVIGPVRARGHGRRDLPHAAAPVRAGPGPGPPPGSRRRSSWRTRSPGCSGMSRPLRSLPPALPDLAPRGCGRRRGRCRGWALGAWGRSGFGGPSPSSWSWPGSSSSSSADGSRASRRCRETYDRPVHEAVRGVQRTGIGRARDRPDDRADAARRDARRSLPRPR